MITGYHVHPIWDLQTKEGNDLLYKTHPVPRVPLGRSVFTRRDPGTNTTSCDPVGADRYGPETSTQWISERLEMFLFKKTQHEDGKLGE